MIDSLEGFSDSRRLSIIIRHVFFQMQLFIAVRNFLFLNFDFANKTKIKYKFKISHLGL